MKKRAHTLTIRVTFDKPVGENEAPKLVAEMIKDTWPVSGNSFIVKGVTRKVRQPTRIYVQCDRTPDTP